MVAARKHVDLEDKPDIVDLTHLVRDGREPIEIREAGQTVAIVQPVTQHEAAPREISDEDLAAFRAAAGSWKVIVDVDTFPTDNREGRKTTTRPHVEL